MTKFYRAKLPTRYGFATIYAFRSNNKEHCCLVFGDIEGKKDVLCRIHSSCITGDIFHSLKCDCGEQLDYALKKIGLESGLLIYLNQEGRDIGLINKIRAYALQDEGYDTVEANELLGLPVDNRDYYVVRDVLKEVNVKSVKTLTNNPDKIKQLKNFGIKVSGIIPIVINSNIYNEKYLTTKKEKMDHYL